MKPSKNRRSSPHRVVLGLNAFSHDAAAALVVDGELVFAAEEERYDRRKHSPAFPARALAAALAHGGLGPEDIDAVAFPWRRGMACGRRALYVLARLPRSFAFLREAPRGLPGRVGHLRAVAGLRHRLAASGIRAPLVHVDHHLAHAVQAWAFGPRDDAALLTADGLGEWTATATWRAGPGGPCRLRARGYPHSLGKVYAAVTEHLGFLPEADEGKTMGLAPYGTRDEVDAFRNLLVPDPSRLYRIDPSAFAFPLGSARLAGAPFEARFGPPRPADAPLEPRHAALARAVQEVLEEVVLDVARGLRQESGATHLGLAGGIFLNCVVNGRLLREAGFSSQFCFPAAGDAGAAAGAAARVAGMPRRLLRHPYLGDAFGPAAIEAALGGRPHRVATDPAADAAQALAEGRTVGWFCGRAEFGPRALGARSILADPRDPSIRDRLNRTVKFREGFRPFAPAVLEEEAGAWFEGACASPFMLLTFPVRPDVRERIPGVVHVDGSARVQTVARDHALPPFRRLLERFAALTGVPLVLNTSFNVRGEPIVRSPGEAVACFEATALDLLVLEDRIVEK